MSDRTFEGFCGDVHGLLNGTAHAKAYNETGADGPNQLYEFVQGKIAGGTAAHALGEVVYKAVRYQAKGNPEDLLKIAAWAFLAWKYHSSRS